MPSAPPKIPKAIQGVQSAVSKVEKVKKLAKHEKNGGGASNEVKPLKTKISLTNESTKPTEGSEDESQNITSAAHNTAKKTKKIENCSSVFVNTIPSHLTVQDLKKHFKTFGKIREIKLIFKEKAKKSKGFALVEFKKDIS